MTVTLSINKESVVHQNIERVNITATEYSIVPVDANAFSVPASTVESCEITD